jgi:hypothetical protein
MSDELDIIVLPSDDADFDEDFRPADPIDSAKFTPSRLTLAEQKRRKADRIAQLMGEGHIVVEGKTGLTVLKRLI